MSEHREEKARKFRNAYQQNTELNVEIIPSKKDLGIEDRFKQELVGPYCRVSTLAESQVESYELQKAYYEDYVNHFPDWTLVDVYADEGISATSMRNRKDFNRLIGDCKDGKITKIITKSVSRFARNVVDAISTVRMLRLLPSPVSVYFETEHIDTLSGESDSQLSLLASFAESESLNKSTSMKWAIRSRFARYIPRVCASYGFRVIEKEVIPDKIEGEVIRMMYERLLDGFSPGQIAEYLTYLKIPTPSMRNEAWSTASVMYILSNEKNCGDIRMQKTVTIDVFTHKTVRNTGQERSYLIRGHHAGHISRENWERAQAILGTVLLQTFFMYQREVSVPEFDSTFYILDASKGVRF